MTRTGIYQPAEWAPHRACWLAWPSAANLWQEDLPAAQAEFTALARAIGESENLEILVPDSSSRRAAETALRGLPVRFHDVPFGDIWVRDTGPIFAFDGARLLAARFGFNGWGGKYVLPHDANVSARVAEISGLPSTVQNWVLEGGALDTDGEGTFLTTEQCLLNANRTSGGAVPSRSEIEARLRDSLGAKKVIWIREGLLNDHTDGHVDTIARFTAPGVVACMQAHDDDDPNREVMVEMAALLAASTDASGRLLRVVRVPSPGRVLDEDGEIMPASYMNFYIANRSVIVPTYGTKWDELAVAEIAKLFPDRSTVGLSAKAILSGGGAFHCITQQEPAQEASL